METFAPAMLKQKSPLELFQTRKRVVDELRAMSDGAEGRALTADEKALEERGEKNLKAIDEALEENRLYATKRGERPRSLAVW
jgi:hypothetical protein